MSGENALQCEKCENIVPQRDSIPMFTEIPEGIQPSEKEIRGPDIGTPWRQANWEFLADWLKAQDPECLILDVGAGRGDFLEALKGKNFVALDVYPYPEIDIVCDLTKTNPFRPESFDAALVLNVLEHVFDSQGLFKSVAEILKPGGKLLLAIPFMVKMHQIPLDYFRYTHFALEQLGKDNGLEIERLEGFYDPMFFLGEGIRNIQWPILRKMRGWRQYVGRILLAGVRFLAFLMEPVIGAGHIKSPYEAFSLAPTGYQVVYTKK
ncbi:MAG: class I SAM-dependent methyltransferase [Anaerolineales bacterium]|nr:class I SAM-dependent methyltransferase [Chloroflexota bacterium]MBL6979860.1 class I SAM-dependent methyltransferase [Anaerolineales bacterium]